MSKAITKSKMNIRHWNFCYEYIKEKGNGTQAAINVGFSKRTARTQASKLLTNVNIQQKIAEIWHKNILKDDLTVAEALKHMIRLTNYDITQLLDEEGSLKNPHDWPEDLKHVVQGIEVVESSRGYGEDKEYYYTKKIKMPDRTKALEMISKYLKMFTERVEHSGEINLIIRPASQDDGDNGKLLPGEKEK